MSPRRRSAVLRLAAVVLLLAVSTVGGVAPARAGEPGDVPFLTVHIDRVTPEVVTTASEPTVTVAGTVTNIGDRTVRDVVVRLEHAPAVSSSAGLRTNLDGTTDQFQPVGDFVPVAPELQRGQDERFNFTYPLRSAAGQSLLIDRPGVYPMLVNVNGTPDYGAPARLDDARFLLPVLGVPPAPDAVGIDGVAGPSNFVAPDTAAPVQMTMLWPLADRPRLAAGAPGGTTPVRLTDDDLAASLAPAGRLDTLLAAAEFATSEQVDPLGEVGSGLCLAVDPDLLVTVNAMTAGYVVADNPGDRNSPTRPGTGQAAATAWLDRLRELSKRVCVTATTYAQADLDALQRVGDPGLNTIATTATADVVDQILGVPTTRGATLVGDGVLTDGSVALLSAQGTTVAITAAACSAQDTIAGKPAQAELAGSPATADVTPRRLSPGVVTAPFDPTVGAALAAVGSAPISPTYLDDSLAVPVSRDSPTARRQDAIASMLWVALNPQTTPRSQILLPPMGWNLAAQDAQAILTAMRTAIRSGLAVPRPLAGVIADSPAAAKPAQLVELAAAVPTRGRIDDAVTGDIRGQIGRLWGLNSALTTDTRTGLSGTQYTAPLREDMLRALSQSVPPDTRNGLAAQRLSAVNGTLGDMLRAVSIVNPGGSYTLATEHSPLPLALRNDLPVPVRVRLQVDAPRGMTVTDVGEIELPPGYLPLRVPIEVHFTQRVAVDVTLRTPDGLALGEPVRLSVHSNAYGQVLFLITLAGSAVLAVLVGRRLWHRFRGQPDPADLDRPEPE